MSNDVAMPSEWGLPTWWSETFSSVRQRKWGN